LRCPRGLPLTETISKLKSIAASMGKKKHRHSSEFYRTFMETVQRYGRIREMEFINRYFFSLKNPFFPLSYLPVGIKLMLKRKIPFELPILTPVKDESGKTLYFKGRFDQLFRKVKELETEE
jgi:heterodisulfide reductase subunit C